VTQSSWRLLRTQHAITTRDVHATLSRETTPQFMATPAVARLLAALEYPFAYAGDAAGTATLMSWVEDRKVRMWEIEQRTALRAPGPAFDAALASYLGELGCPVRGDRALVWLLHEAVKCELEDGAGDSPSQVDPARVAALCAALGGDDLAAATARVAARHDADSGASPDASAALRLFYVGDLRRLQDGVNGILERGQNFVANPKTNAALGKVGR